MFALIMHFSQLKDVRINFIHTLFIFSNKKEGDLNRETLFHRKDSIIGLH
jgi:hypothetical protein